MKNKVALLILLLGSCSLWGQLVASGNSVQIVQGGNTVTVDSGGAMKVNLGELGGTTLSGANVVDTGNSAFKVNCVVGCSAAGSFTDNTAFTNASTSVTNISGVYNDAITSLTSGNAGAIRATTDRMLFVNIGKLAGTVTSVNNGTVDAGTLRVTLASNGTGQVALAAGSAIIGKTVPVTACGTTSFSQALAFVPNSATSVTATTTCVLSMLFNNTTSSAVTVTISDASTNCSAGVCQSLSALSIPANSQLLQPMYGQVFTSGIKWQASSASAVVGGIVGLQ